MRISLTGIYIVDEIWEIDGELGDNEPLQPSVYSDHRGLGY